MFTLLKQLKQLNHLNQLMCVYDIKLINIVYLI